MDFMPEHSSLDEDDAIHTRYAPILAENVKRLRKQANINTKRFALMVEIGRPFLNKIENGTANPRLSVIVKMADALETTPGDLLKDSRERCGKSDRREPLDGETRHAQLR